MRKIRVGSDFSGVGAFNQALMKLGIDYDEVFACDIDNNARTTFVYNYGEPKYYPKNVYDRLIPDQSLDIYMTSPPCQSFSIAGKRKGENDDRGVLFYNSHEFIKRNKPRFFIFENVEGLLSIDKGGVFGAWIDLLGGKSINGVGNLFPHTNSVPYHIYYKVLNTRDYGIPQNRKRVFIVGIRDDQDNYFKFPVEEKLKLKLKDLLEEEVDEKYYLSEKTVNSLLKHRERHLAKGNGFGFNPIDLDKKAYSGAILTSSSKNSDNFLKVKSNTKKGHEIAKIGDSVNYSFPSSKTRRGRVGKSVAQTLDTSCNIGTFVADMRGDNVLRIRNEGVSPCITASMRAGEQFKLNTGSNPPIHNYKNNRFRRLTPRECFRLQGFPDTFDFSVVSDMQAYKQAGNSITVDVLAKIIKNLKL